MSVKVHIDEFRLAGQKRQVVRIISGKMRLHGSKICLEQIGAEVLREWEIYKKILKSPLPGSQILARQAIQKI